ncbi:GrpB family protein [Streptomyces sp. NBC_01460]|uniref:GrpB family protein n=1 Tax=Streptomyces sp. NBC_01460 TaxID=2903875 RepID=UPI003FCDF348
MMWVFLKIEHISSTAVPGVAARPAIDLMGLPSTTSRMLHPTEQCSPTSVSTPTTAGRLTGRCASAQNGVRGQILHVVTLESWPTRNQRILRDQRARARLAVGRRSRIGDHGCVVGNVTPTAIISERRITGFSAVVIAELVAEVRPLWHERHQARLASRSRKRAVGAGAKHRMVSVDRLPATLVPLRHGGARDLLACWFGVDPLDRHTGDRRGAAPARGAGMHGQPRRAAVNAGRGR